jgi:hypothetical protein
MATATFKFNTTNKSPQGDVTQDCVTYYGTVTFSASGDTYATGGLLPLTGFAMANLGPYANRTPLYVDFQSTAGSGWWYQWNYGTGKLQIFGGGASGAATTSNIEFSNATALSGGTPSIFADTVNFKIVFPKTIS